MSPLEADFLEKPQSSPMPLILIAAMLGLFLLAIWPWGQM